MKKFLLFIVLISNSVFSQNYLDFIFKQHKTDGGIVILNENNTFFRKSNDFEARKRTPPAATFQMLGYLLIAKEYPSYIKSRKLKWDGVKRMFFLEKKTNWQKDHTLNEAFKQQNDFFFNHFSNKIPTKKIKEVSKKSGYTNNKISKKTPYFWQFGTFDVSSAEQINFLQKLNNHQLPFSENSQNSLKKLLLIREKNDYKLYGTTAYTVFNKKKVQWFTGWISTKKDTYYFSCRIYQPIENKNNQPSEQLIKKITSEVFHHLSII